MAPAEFSEGHWIAAFDRAVLRKVLDARAVRIALASTLGYLEAPALAADGVQAAIGDGGAAFRVAVRMTAEGALASSCSRCATPLEVCAHAAILAVDLACSTPLRRRLCRRTSMRARRVGLRWLKRVVLSPARRG